MKFNLALLSGFTAISFLCACSADTRSEPEDLIPRINSKAGATQYTNAYWYRHDGTITFEKGDRYAMYGLFVDSPPGNFEVVDLAGLYVVPPFGEAHNHSIESLDAKETAEKYLKQGVFYYKNPNSVYTSAKPALAHWADPETLDVIFSYGGLSKDEGHPEKLYRRLSSFGMYPKISADEWEGNAFYDVDTMQELDEKWQSILDKNPDFLKLYLLNYDTDASAGLPDTIFREIVSRANALGMRTTVHVETVQDLALAVDAGATEAAHLPAYDLSVAKDEARSKIPDTLIAKMAEQNFIIVTTTHVSKGRNYSDEDYAVVAARQADNIKRLHDAGVPLAIGSDTFFDTARNEIDTLKNLDVISDQDLLRLWIDTPRMSIFPDRAIGKLKSGFEASFLALNCNPLDKLDCIDQIEIRVKQGARL